MKIAKQGFTIVELLIVVVVIAILAAITVVAYNGITSDAKTSALKSDLSTAATKLQVAKINGDGAFPTSPDFIPAGLTYSGGGDTFCVYGTANGKDFRITEAGSIQEGECTLALATIQSFTSAQCTALPVYTGSNSAAIQKLTDSRGGVTQTYEVAKLADNKCWMLTNLKLGSESGPITLTPGDSNVADNFILPQLTTTGVAEYDIPKVYGPVSGDTGSGVTNYGYLYNWSAATAGESRTTMPASWNDAAHSICPANWRLPSGGGWNNAAGEFAVLNAKMNNPSATVGSESSGTGFYENWQYTGPFKGVFSGYWANDISFVFQDRAGFFWSWSGDTYDDKAARGLYFHSSYVFPRSAASRSDGQAIRCLLN